MKPNCTKFDELDLAENMKFIGSCFPAFKFMRIKQIYEKESLF